MEDVFSNADRLADWKAVADGAAADWDELFSGYASTVDWPGTLYWRELSDAYPDARILLSVRPEEEWWDSFSRTICKLIEMRGTVQEENLRSVLDYAHQIIAEQTFGGTMNDKQAVLDVYRRRTQDVTTNTPADRLLEFNVTEGWAPLCEFLGVSQPASDFPMINDTAEFWQHFGPSSV